MPGATIDGLRPCCGSPRLGRAGGAGGGAGVADRRGGAPHPGCGCRRSSSTGSRMRTTPCRRPRRSSSAARARVRLRSGLDAGRQRLAGRFGDRFLPALVPPWNRIAPDLVPALPAWVSAGSPSTGPRRRRCGCPGFAGQHPPRPGRSGAKAPGPSSCPSCSGSSTASWPGMARADRDLEPPSGDGQCGLRHARPASGAGAGSSAGEAGGCQDAVRGRLMSEPLLAIRDLRVMFTADEGQVEAVAGVSFDVPPNRTVAVVGESGSGKTVISQACSASCRPTPGSTGGSIFFNDPRAAGAGPGSGRAVPGRAPSGGQSAAGGSRSSSRSR